VVNCIAETSLLLRLQLAKNIQSKDILFSNTQIQHFIGFMFWIFCSNKLHIY